MSIEGRADGAEVGEGAPAAKDRYAGLATLLRSRREALGISRRDLAAATGLSYPYIAQLEGGYRAPSVTTARRLADALRLPVEEIVHATGAAAATAPAPAAYLLVKREDAWLANPAYAPGIGSGRLDADVTAASHTTPTAPLPTERPPTPAAPNAPASPAPGSASTPTPTPVPPPPAPVARPAEVAPPVAAPPSARHGLFGRRRVGTPPEPAGGAPAPAAAPGPVLDPVTATAEQIAALLRALPASDRLDALAAAQRDVMAQLVEDRIRSDSPPSEP